MCIMCSCCLVTQSCQTPCHPKDCSMPGFPVLHHLPELLKLTSFEMVIPSNHLILSCTVLLLPSIFPSIRVFSSESAHWWPKYWNYSLSISPSNEYSGLISFRIDCFDFLAVQGNLRGLLQHHSSKASILQCSGIFMVQHSDPYMTTGKTIALTRWTFASKVMFLHFNMLFRLVIAFLSRSKHLLISQLRSPSTVILEPKKIKFDPVYIFFFFLPSICHEVMGLDAMILVFWMLSFKLAFSFSSFTFINRLFSSSSLSARRVVSSAHLRLLMFFLSILIPTYASSSLTFLMMYSACKLNKQGDNIQLRPTPFPILNQSVVPCLGLTVASWSLYRFYRRQMRWSGIPISWRIFCSWLWSTQSMAFV